MAKTNWQDPKTSEARSTHISGLQEAVGKIEESLGIGTIAETNISLTELFIDNDSRYRMFQAPEGKRNWLLSPVPIIKKNGVVITSGFEIDYGGGAIILNSPAISADKFTADVTYTVKIETPLVNALNSLKTEVETQLADNAQQIALKVDKVTGKGLSTEDFTTAEKAEVAKVILKADITYVNNEIAAISDGTPEAFTDQAAIEAAYPTGDAYVKLNLEDGYVWKWSGTEWVQGWIYQSSGIGDNSIAPNKTNFVNIMKNKFNPATRSIGYQLLLAPAIDGSITANASYDTSDFIPVASGDVSITDCRAIAVYDINKTFVIGYNVNPISKKTISVANNGFIKVTFLKTAINTSMVERGNENTSYLAYGVYSFNDNIAIEEKDLKGINLDVNILSNKTALYFGDSITEGSVNGGGYAKIISENNNMTYTNYGQSGTTLAKRAGYTNSVLEKIQSTGATADYIIIGGGVNDSGSGLVPLGELSEGYTATLDEETYCGALESVLKEALTKWPGKKIGYVTMHKMDTRPELGTYYIKAKEICEKWSIPFFDFYFTGGMNTYIPEIKSTYAEDGTHPNALGYEIYYAPKMTAWMKQL